MQQDIFFSNLKEQYTLELPFVVYRKPNASEVTAFLQKDSTINYVSDFQEKGFVFAPFNTAEKPILFKEEDCERITIDSFKKLENLFLVDTSAIISEAAHQFHVALVTNAVSTLKEETDFKKVVLSRKESVAIEAFSPLEVFQNILATYPTAFCYCWYHPSIGLWLGATPETLLKVYRNKLSTMALAGTQRYIEHTEATWGEKEIREQQIVTDTIVEALSDKVQKLEVSKAHTHRAGNLLHLKTDISGTVAMGDDGIKEVITALHPTPAVCGLPRERAKNFIVANEGYDRSFYSGYLGELNNVQTTERNRNRRNVENSVYKSTATGSHLFVNLRCMEYTDGLLHFYVGGGIVEGSDGEAEWQETVHKSNTMKKILPVK
ncbi:chorismate-binding protein [Neptunitalea lumnitzerae]|uniref:Chorismate-utilising enzyme C-terminal domain-containing protein n=1 Tax=Neptunitalea lumnitzerae TaxID=2965509 RepID=A0ABQ5MM57_9FLAO|nr:chorismate-binding protein [Neptunitalea sp. Y10]GLB50476.1 hypothetical protein Y10_28440 [Neptunitalea sp. Y10]